MKVSDVDIVHADMAFIDRDPRDGQDTLHVNTKLALNPQSPGFDAGAMNELLEDIKKKFRGGPDAYGCDSCIVHASDCEQHIRLNLAPSPYRRTLRP